MGNGAQDVSNISRVREIGRVVSSTGKIKTHTQEFGKDDCFVLEDKDGITIENAHCIVRLSNKRKTKR